MDENVIKLEKWIKESDNIVFFGGAGVSTESGIPDFRSVDGLYNQKYDYPPETILSHSFFMRKTEEFYRFYRDKMLYKDATAIGPIKSVCPSFPARKMDVGPSAPPIIDMAAAAAPLNPKIIARKYAAKIPICAAAPSKKLLGLAISGPKSVIAPTPKKISDGRILHSSSR